jgi:hypothetical protein
VVLGLVVVCALCLALGLGVVVGVVLPLFIGRGDRGIAKEVSGFMVKINLINVATFEHLMK